MSMLAMYVKDVYANALSNIDSLSSYNMSCTDSLPTTTCLSTSATSDMSTSSTTSDMSPTADNMYG